MLLTRWVPKFLFNNGVFPKVHFLCKMVMRRTQQSLLEWKGVGSKFWLATTNFNLLEKFWLHFQNEVVVCAKCQGYQQLHWWNSGYNMESPTSTPPIHANNQAMQYMAYS